MERGATARKSVPSPGGRPPKADPAVYSQIRRQALETRIPKMPRGAVHVVLMDWHVDKGTVTVIAAADGSASVYLSSGERFIGGSELVPGIRDAALHTVALATGLQLQFQQTDTSPLPSLGDVTFYLTTSDGVYRAVAAEVKLRAGADPLAGLGGAMQRIVREYRVHSPGHLGSR